MCIPALEEFFLHQSIEWLQIPFRTLNDPIRHGFLRKVQAITGEFPFLTRQGHAIDILFIHDACHQGLCYHTTFKKRRRLFRFKDGKDAFLRDASFFYRKTDGFPSFPAPAHPVLFPALSRKKGSAG